MRMQRRWGPGAVAFLVLLMSLCLGVANGSAQEEPAEQEQGPSPELRVLGQEGDFGIGLGGGTFSSGLSLKYYIFDRNAVQGIVGLWGSSSLALGLDYVQELEEPLFVEPELGHLVAGFGGGVAAVFYSVGLNSATLFGVNALGALTWQFRNLPLEISIELRPTILIGDFVGGFYLGTGGAIRYYF